MGWAVHEEVIAAPHGDGGEEGAPLKWSQKGNGEEPLTSMFAERLHGARENASGEEFDADASHGDGAVWRQG